MERTKQVLLCLAFMFIIGILIFGILLPVISGTETLGTFEKDHPVFLTQTASNSTYCNLTKVSFPNSSYEIIGTYMSKNGFNYNYTFNSTSSNGQYIVTTCCNPNAVEKCSSYDFFITPNGETSTVAGAILYIGILISLVVFILFLFYMFGKAESLIAKVSSMAGIYLLFIALSFVAWQLVDSFITSNSFLTEFLRIVFIVLMVGFFPFLIILFAWGIYMMITIKEITDMMDKGMEFGEASERSKWKK